MKTIIQLALVSSVIMFAFSSCKDEKACRCMIESNAENAPPVLFEIQYVKEDEDCSDLDKVSRIYAQGVDPIEADSTGRGFVQTTITCTDRIEE
jgi:hypothetical protein